MNYSSGNSGLETGIAVASTVAISKQNCWKVPCASAALRCRQNEKGAVQSREQCRGNADLLVTRMNEGREDTQHKMGCTLHDTTQINKQVGSCEVWISVGEVFLYWHGCKYSVHVLFNYDCICCLKMKILIENIVICIVYCTVLILTHLSGHELNNRKYSSYSYAESAYK